MMKYLKAAIRKWTMDSDTLHPSFPPAAGSILEGFSEGELLPFKGIMFRIVRVAGGDHPLLMLVPVDATRGHKLKVMREYRDAGRAHLGRQAMMRKELEKAVHASRPVDE